MKAKQKTKNKFVILVYCFGVAFFFGSGILYISERFRSLQQVSLVLGITTLFLISKSKPAIKISSSSDLFFYIMVLFVFLSFLVNHELSILFSSLGLLLIWITATIFIPKIQIKYGISPDFTCDIIAGLHLIMVLYSFSQYRMNLIRYRGIFINSNSFGEVSLTFSTLALFGFSRTFESFNKRRRILYGVFLIFGIFLVLISNSRTCFVSMISTILISLFVLMKRSSSYKIKKQYIWVCLGFLILLYIGYNFSDFPQLINKIVFKFQAKSGDILDGRVEKWDIVFQRMKLFGNGEKTSFGAHNTFFSILDQYGFTASLSLILFVIAGIYNSSRIAFMSKKNTIVLLPLLTYLAFGVSCLTEGMMLKSIMLIMLYSTVYIHKAKET